MSFHTYTSILPCFLPDFDLSFSKKKKKKTLFDLPELPTAWWFLDWEEIYYCSESRKQEAKGSRHLHSEEPLLKMSPNEFLRIEAPTSSHFLSSFSKAIMHFHLFLFGLHFSFSVSLNFCFLFMIRLIHSFCWQTYVLKMQLSRVHAESNKTPPKS